MNSAERPAPEDLAWQDVGAANEWQDGVPRLVTIGKRRIGVYLVDGRWYAIKDICPHAGAPLHQGHLVGSAIACPLHGWTFDLATGQGPDCRVACYEVRIADGRVLIGY